MIHLFLVRHGTTSAIELRHLQGASDSPLSARGREEARLAGAALKNSGIEYAFSSPMGRTRETADIICGQLGLDYTILDDLREMDFGFFEGRDYFDAPERDSPLFMRLGVIARIMVAQVTGESLRKVENRASRAWQEISLTVGEGKVLVVSHGALINYLLKVLLPKHKYQEFQPVQADPCSITELEVTRPGNTRILRLADNHHLKSLPKFD